MDRHPVSFENLADWVDDHLDQAAAEAVRAHLETGCPECHADLAWLRRVIGAAKGDDLAEPPVGAVARAKQLFRQRSRLARWRRLVVPPAWRWVPAIAMALALLVGAASLSQVPTLLPAQARLSEVAGAAELRGVGGSAWQSVQDGAVLSEGDLLRISEASAVLSLFDGTRLGLQPGAQVLFETLRSGLFGASYHIALRQFSGSVEYDVAPLRGGRCRFEAETPTVRVSVQGTRFVITVETIEETRVTVLQGSVRLDSAEQSAVLMEREAAIVPASAPLVRLPTLTPTFTPLPVLPQTAAPGLEPSRTPPVTHTPTAVIETAAPSVQAVVSPTAMPLVTPTAAATVPMTRPVRTLTPEVLLTASPVRFELTGAIEAFPPDVLGAWRIAGREVVVRRTTLIRGRPAVGLQAYVECLMSAESSAGRQVCVAVAIDIAEAQPAPGERPTATPWWGAATTLLPPPVQTMLPQLPTLPLPTSLMPPDILSTMVAWPTEHPIQLPWLGHTPRPRPTLGPSATPVIDGNAAAVATPISASMSAP